MGTSLLRELEALQALRPGPSSLEPGSEEWQPVVEAVTRLFEADRVVLILFDRDREVVHSLLRGGPGWAQVLTTIPYQELQLGLSGWALTHGQVALSPASTPDDREAPEVQERRRATECGSILVAPLVTGTAVDGTLTVINRLDQGDHSPVQAQELGVLARAVGLLLSRAQAQRDTETARLEAKAAIRSKLNFLSNLSHELRTPLNAVLGFANLLEGTNLTEGQRTMVATIGESGRRLLQTVDNLLELAQFETGQFRLDAAPFSPRATLEAVLRPFEAAASLKALDWTVTSSPDLPSVVVGDSVRLGQAWNHILSNAVKFTEQGGVRVHLDARRLPRGRHRLTLQVEDTGIGMRSPEAGQWFVPFHQEDGSLTRRFGGTGLGLTLCDRLSREMGGGLSLLGEPGVGTKAKVWVEVGRDERFEPAPAAAVNVLLYVNTLVTSLPLVRWLERSGHRVDVVTEAGLVEARLQEHRYSVLVAEASGLDPELRSRLRNGEATRGKPLIGLFATEPRASQVAGWTRALTAPFSPESLEDALGLGS